MKKFLYTALASLGSAVAFAEETGGSSTSSILDTSAATEVLTDLQGAMTSWVATALPILATIAGAFLAFWLGKMIFRLVKGWTNSAK